MKSLPHHVLGWTTIEVAAEQDASWIDSLQRQLVNNTGFVPTTAIADHLQRRSYALLSINGQPVGYSMSAGGIRRNFRLIQIAISKDAWRYGLGTELIKIALAVASTRPKPNMTATVRDGLPMNTVVKSTGAKVTGHDHTPKARGKILTHYAWENSQSIHPASPASESTPHSHLNPTKRVLNTHVNHTTTTPRPPRQPLD